MLTKWGKKVFSIPRDNYTTWGLSSSYKACIKAKCSNGDNYNIGTDASSDNGMITSFTHTGSGCTAGTAFGSGGTPATENDYTIESLITTLTLSATPQVITAYDSSTGKYSCHIDYTLSNNSGSDVTIREVARFIRVHKGTNLGDNIQDNIGGQVCIMLDRTVLETPLTIPNGTSAILRYSFLYDMDAVE